MELGQIRFINEKEAKTLIDMPTCVDLMERCFREYGKGRVEHPVKLHLSLRPEYDSYLNSMPSFLKDSNLMGVKLAGCTKKNTSRGLPTSIGIIVLFHPENGVPYAVVDGTFITAIRTGAIVGLQAKYLAKKGAKVLAVIGAGAQGFTSLEAIQAALKGAIEEVRIVDVNPQMIEKYKARAAAAFPKVKVVVKESIQEACSGADIVASCANAGKPLLMGIEFDKGAHVISVSERIQSPKWIKETFTKMTSDFPECLITRENQENLWAAQQKGEEPVVLHAGMIDEILSDIIVGKAKGRETENDIIFSATVGMSMEDVVAAHHVYEQAEKRGLGRVLDYMDLEGFRAGK